MIMSVVRVALVCAALAACGPATEGFEKGFNESWAKSTKEGCIKTATANAGAAAAEQYCSCVIDQLASLSTKEKMEMKPDTPAVQAAVAKCGGTQ